MCCCSTRPVRRSVCVCMFVCVRFTPFSNNNNNNNVPCIPIPGWTARRRRAVVCSKPVRYGRRRRQQQYRGRFGACDGAAKSRRQRSRLICVQWPLRVAVITFVFLRVVIRTVGRDNGRNQSDLPYR